MSDGVVGLRWHNYGAGKRAFWRASKAALKVGFPVASWNLWHGAGDVPPLEYQRIVDTCVSLNGEQRAWLQGKRRRLRNYAPGGGAHRRTAPSKIKGLVPVQSKVLLTPRD